MADKNPLGIDIQGDGKILPLGEVNGRGPQQRGVAVEDLEGVRRHVWIREHGARLEHELVSRVVCRLVEDIEVLVAQVERPGGILLNAPVDRLEALVARASLVGVVGEEEARSAEAILLLEDGLITDGDLDGLVRGVVESGVGDFREEQDVAPGEVVALGVTGVEQVILDVKVRQSSRGGDSALEDHGTLNCAGRGRPGFIRSSRNSTGADGQEEGSNKHFGR